MRFFVAKIYILVSIFSSLNANAREIIVATSPDYPPFEYIENEKLYGIDIDIIKAISAETGLVFRFVQMDFKSIIASLNVGKVDIAISGLSKTKAREKLVDFSEVYYNTKTIFICKNEKKCDQSKISNNKIGVQIGSVQELDINNILQKSGSSSFGVKQATAGLYHLRRGDIDFFAIDELSGIAMIKDGEFKYFIPEIKSSGGNAIAFRKNFEYKKEINDAIIKFKNNGVIDYIVKENLLGNKNKNTDFKAIIWILKGSLVTIKYAISAFLLGFLIANIILPMRLSKIKIIRSIAIAYVSILRGIPILVQLTFIYFLLPKLIGREISIFISGVIAFSINSSAYLVEILRAGIKNVPNGQILAAKTLNIPKFYIYKDIVAPQAIRSIFPSLTQELISLIKESAIISMIGEYDIMRRADVQISQTYDFIAPLLTAGAAYYIMCMMVFIIGVLLEKHFFKYGRN